MSRLVLLLVISACGACENRTVPADCTGSDAAECAGRPDTGTPDSYQRPGDIGPIVDIPHSTLGGTWTDEKSKVPALQDEFTAVWGSTSGDVYVADYGGGVFHFDGSSWKRVAAYNHRINDIWGTGPNDVYIVGDVKDGTYSHPLLVHFDGSEFKTIEADATIGLSLLRIAGSGSDNIYAISERDVVHYDGTRWSQLPSPGDSLRDVWVGTAGPIVVGGNACSGCPGLIWRYTGSTWKATKVPDVQLHALWGGTAQSAFGTGYPSAVMRYDGSKWEKTFTTNDRQSFGAVWGASDSDVVALGDNNQLWHWDGTRWSALTNSPPGGPYFRIWMTKQDVWLVGLGVARLHRN